MIAQIVAALLALQTGAGDVPPVEILPHHFTVCWSYVAAFAPCPLWAA